MFTKAFKIRIYPTGKQKEYFLKCFGCRRLVYNTFLSLKRDFHKEEGISLTYSMCSMKLTEMKKMPEYSFLKEVDSTSLQSSLKDLDKAYDNFFKKKGKYPRFKKKGIKDSFRTINNYNSIRIENGRIKLPKVGFLKTKGLPTIQGRILNATVSMTKNNKFFVSLCVETTSPQLLPKTGKVCGLDLGLKDYVIFDDGTKIENPKFYEKQLKRIVRHQRKLSRCKENSKNREKARLQVAKDFEKLVNKRMDFLHKLTLGILREYDVIGVETLKVKKMQQDRKYSRRIQDASWSIFLQLLQYKAEWYGKELVKIDQFFASTQTCSECGCINKETKDTSIREWTCPVCGAHHDRDINAAINIKNEAVRLSMSL